MKEMWEKPRILVEEFAPNDYVAVCYQVACGNETGGNKLPKKVDEAGNETDDFYTKTELWGAYGKEPTADHIRVDGNLYWVRDEHEGACKDPNKNAIQVNGNNISIWEDSGFDGTLRSEIMYYEDRGDEGYGKGDLFAWVTFGNSGTLFSKSCIWLHWAIAGVANAFNPNRS